MAHTQSRRLASVQTPIIPIVSRWIADTPGTVSLGQGVVSYGPPGEALAALRSFPTHATDHRYGAVEGEAPLVALIEEKLRKVHTSLNAMTLAERLIREHLVAVIPGSAFGASQGCHIRVSYGALDAQTAQEGVSRLGRGLRALAS